MLATRSVCAKCKYATNNDNYATALRFVSLYTIYACTIESEKFWRECRTMTNDESRAYSYPARNSCCWDLNRECVGLMLRRCFLIRIFGIARTRACNGYLWACRAQTCGAAGVKVTLTAREDFQMRRYIFCLEMQSLFDTADVE